MGFEPHSLDIVALGRAEGAMAEQRRCRAHLLGRMDGERRRSSIPKQVRIERLTESSAGVRTDRVVDRHLRHRRSVLDNPQGIARIAMPSTPPAGENWPILRQVFQQRIDKQVRQVEFEGGMRFGVFGFNSDTPGAVKLHQIAPEAAAVHY